MLFLRRNEGQWVTATHTASGDILRIRVCQIQAGLGGSPAHLNLVFEDADRLFEIERPERHGRRDEVAGAVAEPAQPPQPRREVKRVDFVPKWLADMTPEELAEWERVCDAAGM